MEVILTILQHSSIEDKLKDVLIRKVGASVRGTLRYFIKAEGR